jgi:hypothetical protein
MVGVGRSGAMDRPLRLAVSSTWPVADTSATSCADSCSRSRSNASGPGSVRVSPRRSAATRVLAPRSVTSASSVPRPRSMPASSALCTLASNHTSMLRDTNCTLTV